jgi:hypothetical protein
MATSTLGAIYIMRQRERARAFPYTLGIFSVKESVFLCFEHYLVLKKVFPCALGTFSVKESISLYFGYI